MKWTFLLIATAAVLAAQNATSAAGAAANTATSGAAPAECSPGRLRVTSVEPTEAALGGTVALRIEGLNECLAVWPSPVFVLHIAGFPMPALKPVLPAAGDNRLQFPLSVTAAGRTAWDQIFAASRAEGADQGGWRARRVAITVSPGPGLRPYPSAASGFTLRLLSDTQWMVWLLIVSSLLLLLVWAARSSNALRDPPGPQGATPGGRPPFSLARCQMAAWFYVVLAAYLLIWMTTGNQPALTAGALALMGISAGTGLFAATVDTTKRNANREKAAALERELRGVQQQLGAPGLTPDARALLEASAERLRGELTEVLAQLTPGRTAGFFTDILSDANGLSFHRVQMLAWTVTLILIFIGTVLASLAMPDFDSTVLGLMGISAGTYLGFKFPERTEPARP